MTNCDNIYGLDDPKFWSIESAFKHLASLGVVTTKRSTERRLQRLKIFPPSINSQCLRDENGVQAIQLLVNSIIKSARKKRKLVLFAQIGTMPSGRSCIYLNDARGAWFWLPLKSQGCSLDNQEIVKAFDSVKSYFGRELVIFPHGSIVASLRDIKSYDDFGFRVDVFRPRLLLPQFNLANIELTTHLKRLEDESIYIIREALSESENPAMLYSIGKDSSVMVHLALKAFYPSPIPFPLLHVDTRWKFQEMYLFRDWVTKKYGLNLNVYINPEAVEKNINPFDHGSSLHTQVTKTNGLKQALEKYKYDLVFGGARRDEEKSRAKERIFSFRDQYHQWDPKNQRPEIWNLFNAKKNIGESIRVFPLSNWTELDIWQYIFHQNIPVVPLYFAKKRPVVIRNNLIIMVDDERFVLLPNEEIIDRNIRFRTLGCYPLTGAVDSKAQNVSEIILELIRANTSERQGRAIDSDVSGSMEKKKREGYF